MQKNAPRTGDVTRQSPDPLGGIDRRAFLAVALTATISIPARAAPRRPDAIVSKSGRAGTVPTLGEALHIVRRLARPSRILVERGEYEEKLRLDVADLHLEGEGPQSIISFGAAAGLLDPAGKKWGTGGSATLAVAASGVSLSRLTVRNSFDYLQDRITNASGGAQAVALSIVRGSDRVTVRDCTIEGYQDTLYVQEGCRTWFRNCAISGNVDFIFGGATAMFEQCEIRSRFIPGATVQGYVAAPSTPATVPTGLVFDRCRLTREQGLPDASVYLGRPWRAGGNMQLTGAATYLNCWMDAHIRADGWTSMGYRDPAGVRRELTPQEARLYEYGSLGPGAGPAGATRRHLSSEQVPLYRSGNGLGGWRPD